MKRIALLALLCGSCSPQIDFQALSGQYDAGAKSDAGTDAGTPDSGVADAGTAEVDAGSGVDAGTPVDGGGNPSDAGRLDAGTCLTLVTGFDARAAPPLAGEPPLNANRVDPRFGVTARRVTAHPTSGTLRHLGPARPAFNSNSTRLLLTDGTGLSMLPLAGTIAPLQDPKLNEDPTWDVTNPDQLWYLGSADLVLHSMNVTTGTSSVVANFTTPIRAAFATAAKLTTHGTGRPSNTGDVWCVAVEDNAGATLGFAALDTRTATVLGSTTITRTPLAVMTSPKGTHCVVAFDDVTNVWAVNFALKQKLSSLALQEVALSVADRQVALGFDADAGAIMVADIVTRADQVGLTLVGPTDAGTSVVISTPTGKSGYVLLSTYDCRGNCGPGVNWFQDKVLAVTLESPPKIYHLLGVPPVLCGATCRPDAVANTDLTQFVVTSGWQSMAPQDAAAYVADVPACSLP